MGAKIKDERVAPSPPLLQATSSTDARSVMRRRRGESRRRERSGNHDEEKTGTECHRRPRCRPQVILIPDQSCGATKTRDDGARLREKKRRRVMPSLSRLQVTSSTDPRPVMRRHRNEDRRKERSDHHQKEKTGTDHHRAHRRPQVVLTLDQTCGTAEASSTRETVDRVRENTRRTSRAITTLAAGHKSYRR